MSWPLLFLLLSFPSIADELLPIEVKATKDAERFTFGTSETLSTPQFRKENLGLVSPVVEKVPGVIANQNGGPGGRVSYFIRGTESRHVSFLLDGLKINDTSNTDRQFDAAFLPTGFIKELTVYKGPQAVLYGSDALGGIIDMKTRKGDSSPESRLSVTAGSFGTVSSTLAKDWNTKKSRGTLTATRFHTDGISRLNKKRYDADERDATDITQLTSSSDHQWSNKVDTELLASYLHGKAEQDGFADDNNEDFSRNDQFIFQQKTNLEVDRSNALSLRTGFNRHQRFNSSRSSQEEFFNGNLYQSEVIHRLEKGNLGLLSGLSTDHETARAKNMDRELDLHSAFIQSAIKLNKWKFQTGGRVDKHSRFGTFYTGSAGVAWADFSVQYSQGYKAPSLYQLYGPDSFGSPVANPNLIPETNHSWEASWKKKTENLETQVSVFQNRLSNLITYSLSQGYLNQNRFIAEGVEVSGKYDLRSFQFHGSFTHQNFRDVDNRNFLNEKEPILRRPKNSSQIGVSYFYTESLELNATVRTFSARKDYDKSGGIKKLNGYEVYDLSVRKVWEKDELSLQLKNVLNREYEDLFGFSVMPRSLFAQYEHLF